MAAGSLLVVATDGVQAPNDKNQVEPMLEKIGALSEGLGKVEHLLADTGYFSAGNVEACEKAGVEPVIAMGRQPHHPPLSERFEKAPDAPKDPTPVAAMAHRLKTPRGRALHALRKQTPEPVFGIIKSALGFRQFLLRGLEKVRGEWSLVTMAWNLKRCSPSLRPIEWLEPPRAENYIRSRSNCINSNPPTLRSRSIQAANSKIDIVTQSQITQSDSLLEGSSLRCLVNGRARILGTSNPPQVTSANHFEAEKVAGLLTHRMEPTFEQPKHPLRLENG